MATETTSSEEEQEFPPASSYGAPGMLGVGGGSRAQTESPMDGRAMRRSSRGSFTRASLEDLLSIDPEAYQSSVWLGTEDGWCVRPVNTCTHRLYYVVFFYTLNKLEVGSWVMTTGLLSKLPRSGENRPLSHMTWIGLLGEQARNETTVEDTFGTPEPSEEVTWMSCEMFCTNKTEVQSP